MTSAQAEVFVHAPIQQAYRAFTNASLMREWLCDLASVDPRPQGRIYLYWNGDYYSCGEFQEVEENKKISFLWQSRNEIRPTLVAVLFIEQENGTLVRLEHSVPDEPEWEKVAKSFREHWISALKCLAFMLETGMDYRIVNRPMLGILPGDFTADQAQKLGVPVTDGIRIDGVVEGMGAQKAGLQRDDVIISMNSKLIHNDFSSLPAAIQGKSGGDKVEVTFYRGPQRQTVTMELSRRPMPQVPFDLQELVKKACGVYEAALNELEKCFEGVSEAEANTKPAPGEWSALEVVAHLVQNERNQRFTIDDIVGGYERWADNWGGNIEAHIRATLQVYPTIRTMLEALHRDIEENLAFLASLPIDFVGNKNAYYRVGSIFVQADVHINLHLEQIKNALAAARNYRVLRNHLK